MKKASLIVACYFLVQLSFSQMQSKEFDALMSEVFNDDGPGAVALVVKDEETFYRKAFGMANLELGVKMKPENIFRIGSNTKQFTASAILKLRDGGHLDLDDDITNYVKDYPTHGHEITIRHLLTHTSGIKNLLEMKEFTDEFKKKDFAPEEVIEFFKYQPMDFKPGEKWKYSNSGYTILGQIIETVSGIAYEQYINDNFFKPLGMTSSYHGSTSEIIKARAYGYNKRDDKYINADFLSMTIPYASGSLLSTVDDMFTWYKAVMEDKVISKESREEAHLPHTLTNGEITEYGFGWRIGTIQGSQMIFHTGGINGFVTISIYLPEEKVFVAIFSNCNCNSPRDIGTKMAALAIGKSYE